MQAGSMVMCYVIAEMVSALTAEGAYAWAASSLLGLVIDFFIVQMWRVVVSILVFKIFLIFRCTRWLLSKRNTFSQKLVGIISPNVKERQQSTFIYKPPSREKLNNALLKHDLKRKANWLLVSIPITVLYLCLTILVTYQLVPYRAYYTHNLVEQSLVYPQDTSSRSFYKVSQPIHSKCDEIYLFFILI